eukprot:scaffold127897_cov60-Phaeocystis_antarctica.AAC.1
MERRRLPSCFRPRCTSGSRANAPRHNRRPHSKVPRPDPDMRTVRLAGRIHCSLAPLSCVRAPVGCCFRYGVFDWGFVRSKSICVAYCL